MTYLLWDTEAGNFIGKYTHEQEALATVKVLVDRYGPDFADEPSLGRVEDDGSILRPLTGRALMARI